MNRTMDPEIRVMFNDWHRCFMFHVDRDSPGI